MLGSSILDVAIGLMFLFLIMSLLSSVILEIVAQWLRMRAKTLRTGISEMLSDRSDVTKMSDDVLKHALVQKSESEKDPSYLSASTFADVLMDLLRLDKLTPGLATLSDLELQIKNSAASPGLQTALKALLATANLDPTEIKRRLEKWYDDSMERVSGWYKRRTQKILIGIGLALAVLLNVDTIFVGYSLWKDETLRDAWTSSAVAFIEQYDPTTADEVLGRDPEELKGTATELRSKLRELGPAIGWRDSKETFLKFDLQVDQPWYVAVLGWILTALAISLGANFWFDLLSKIVNLRSTGPKPDTAGGQPAKS